MEKEKQNKVVSLEEMYWQIQRWLDQADMGDVHHHVSITFVGYEHRKTGKHEDATKDPEKQITIHLKSKTICLMEKSPTIAMEKTRAAIELMQLERDNKDTISDATMVPDIEECSEEQTDKDDVLQEKDNRSEDTGI